MPDEFPIPQSVPEPEAEETSEKTTEESAAEPDEAPEPASEAPTEPVPDSRSLHDRRRDEDAVLGHFVNVVSGEHKGRYGVFIDVESDGETAIVRTRDAENDTFSVPISDLRPAEPGLR